MLLSHCPGIDYELRFTDNDNVQRKVRNYRMQIPSIAKNEAPPCWAATFFCGVLGLEPVQMEQRVGLSGEWNPAACRQELSQKGCLRAGQTGGRFMF